MANHDRVTELYTGQIASSEAQRICRDRIHWMCGQIVGESVLDIGCSQGIASILAAREGHQVLGVDVEEPSLSFAQTELAKETEIVQSRVDFRLSDIFAPRLVSELSQTKFDTILLAEILEHQTQPRRLFELATTFLAPGGRLVVAVPFGLHDHDDHKFTFYLSDTLDTIRDVCKLLSLDIVDGYIRLTVARKDETVAEYCPSFEDLLKLSEEKFLERELQSNKLLGARGKLTRKLQAIETRLEREKTELAGRSQELESKLNSQVADRNSLLAERNEVARELKHAKEELIASQRTASKLANLQRETALDRGLRAISSTATLEIMSGRILREPRTSVEKTVARMRRALTGRHP